MEQVTDFSAGFCSRSSNPLSFHQLLPLGINTHLVWIPALLTRNIRTSQYIFIYFWKLCCSFSFGYRLLLSYYSCWHWTAFFTFIGTLDITGYAEIDQEKKLHAGPWSFWDTSSSFAKGKAALIVSYYTPQRRHNIQAFGQLPKWTIMWLGSINQVKDFKTLAVLTFPLYPPSTRTPFIWVRCIFFSKERESATRIFLQPSRSKICCAKNTKYSGCWTEGHINYLGKSPLGFCRQRERKECLRHFKLL